MNEKDTLSFLIWNYLKEHPLTVDEFGPDPSDVARLAGMILSTLNRNSERKFEYRDALNQLDSMLH